MKKIICGFVAVCTLIVVTAAAWASDHVSTAAPFWVFPSDPPAGNTKIIRTPQGITAQFKTTGLMAGHTATLWVMFFNNPGECENPGACQLAPVDIFNPATGFDFHYAGGRIVNGNKTTISGHIQVGEMSTSGAAELAAIGGWPEDLVTSLTNPMGAQVILAVHSHGPAQTGPALAAQMSSYLGGCDLPLLGVGGFATNASEIPANTGECSTIQIAFH